MARPRENVYPTATGDGCVSREYRVWYCMLRRVKNSDGLNTTYTDVDVCSRWLNFDNFYYDVTNMFGWYNKDVNGNWFTLDKDLHTMFFGGNKVYSRETCFLIPNHLNNLFHINKGKHKYVDLPFGVSPSSKVKGKFDISITKYKKCKSFKTVEEAQDYYFFCKRKILNELLETYKESLDPIVVSEFSKFDLKEYYKQQGCVVVV